LRREVLTPKCAEKNRRENRERLLLAIGLVRFGDFGFINQIPGGVMKSNHAGDGRNEVGVELKYCEHCGGLWVRETGAGTVYCEKCQEKIADLPAPKRKRGRLTLPVRPHTAVEDYTFEIDVEDVNDLEAAGGVA
jgi:hypothetical protein